MNIEEMHAQAMQAYQNKNFDQAISLFNQSLEQNPQHLESYFNRALVRQSMGQYHKALKDLEEALNLAPHNARVYSERAVVRHHLKDQRGALEDLDTAIRLDATNPYRYSSRAYIRGFIGDIEGAIQDYQKALDLDPDDAISLNNIGLLEEKLGHKQKAQNYFKQADQIMDEGKSFEKPDLDQILLEYEEKQKLKTKTQALIEAQNSLDTSEKTSNSPQYWQILKSVFTSRETFNEFLTFVKKGFKNT